MDAVDDLFPPYQFTQWDPNFNTPASPPIAIQDNLQVLPQTFSPNEDPVAIFPTENTSIHDPTEIPFDISPVTSGLTGSFPLPNLSCLPNDSIPSSPPPIPSSSAASHMQQLSQQINYPNSRTHQNSSRKSPSPNTQSQPQPQPSQESPPHQLHLLQQQNRDHHSQPLSHAPSPPHSTPSHQEHYQPTLQLQSQPLPSASLHQHQLSQQQHSPHSQLSLFQRTSRRHSNTMQTSDGVHMSQPMQPVAIDSSQAQLQMMHRPASTSSPDDKLFLQQQHNGLEQQAQFQLQMQSQLPTQQRRQGQAHKDPTALERRRSGLGLQQQDHQNLYTPGERKRQQTQQAQSPRRSAAGQRNIGKQKGTRLNKQQAQMRNQKLHVQMQQREEQIGHAKQGPPEVLGSNFGAPQTAQGNHEIRKEHGDSIIRGQSPQNLFSDITGVACSMPGLSNISIPTPTIATGTTITGTPSATNSTHRSPPQTPYSSNRAKSSAMSQARETQSDMHSSVDKKTCGNIDMKHESIATTTQAKHSQSSLKTNLGISGSGCGSGTDGGLIGCGSRVSKPRDKQAKLRKRLKCCTQEQLIEQLVELVRRGAVEEKTVYESIPAVDVGALVGQSQEILERIYMLMPEDSGRGRIDADMQKRYKKLIGMFKGKIVSNGKVLVDGCYWKEIVEYCVEVADVNEQLPVWGETGWNKLKGSVRGKLEQLVGKAVRQMGKVKGSEGLGEKLSERCSKVFPGLVNALEMEEERARMGQSRLELGI